MTPPKNSEAQEYADRLIDGDLRMDSEEYADIELDVQNEAWQIYQAHFEMSEKDREKAARKQAADENKAVSKEEEQGEESEEQNGSPG